MQDFFAALSGMIAGMEPSDWLAIGSALAATASYVLSRETVHRQERMQFESLRAQRDTDLIAWADAVIERLADAQKLCRDLDQSLVSNEEFRRLQSEARTRISALLDRGRLFFPNLEVEVIEGKEAAFQGKRQKALDTIFFSYRAVSDVLRDGGVAPRDAVLAIVEQKRQFVSEVFLHVDPRRRRDVMSSLER